MADELPKRAFHALERAGYTDPALIAGASDEALLDIPGIGPAYLRAIRQLHNRPGRPTSYQPGFCSAVIEYGGEGMGRAEIAAELGVSRQTLATWESTHPPFLDAMTRAYDASLAWWNRQGRLGIWDETHRGEDGVSVSRRLNAAAYRLQVINRFREDWRDKSELEHLGGLRVDTMTTEELHEASRRLAAET